MWSVGRGWRRPPHLGVRGKFLLAAGVFVPAVMVISVVSALGLARIAGETDRLYTDNLTTTQHLSELVSAIQTVHRTALYQAATDNPALARTLTAELDQTLIPRVHTAITTLRQDAAGDAQTEQGIDGMEGGINAFIALRGSSLGDATGSAQSADKSLFADQADRILESVVQAGGILQARQHMLAEHNKRVSDADYVTTRRWLGISAALVLLMGLFGALALSRNLLPRMRRYSEFAADVAGGRATQPLRPSGHDELTALGVALNDMVSQRELVVAAQEAQAEFIETLQVTGSEEEGQTLVQRHLQRSLPGSEVVVLKRNNSANRLEAATEVPADSELAVRLVGAEPSSCVALRLGRSHCDGSARAPLLSCTLCGDRGRLSSCEPLLVGGEVIGSVLVSHELPLEPSGQAQIKNTVAQAAPMLANLRNLALAEFRANNDALTGLPNKRATEDTLKRMVAQANRSVTSLCAVMLDLDHFKQINDRFGHALGDEVLASVGTTIRACLRDSDFAGRFGGEEFLLLLPDTSLPGGEQVAEKVRHNIAGITVPGVERAITASLGVASLLEEAGSARGLLRAADRAQYAAKAAGRNRTVVASLADVGSAEVGSRPGAVPAPRQASKAGAGRAAP